MEAALAKTEVVSSTQLKKNDLYLVEAGDLLPADGEIVVGIASVDESAVTGESAPVVREAGGDRSCRHRRHAAALGLADHTRQCRPG